MLLAEIVEFEMYKIVHILLKISISQTDTIVSIVCTLLVTTVSVLVNPLMSAFSIIIMIVKVCKYAVNHYCRHTTFTIVLVQNWVLLLAHLQCECVCW